MQQAQQVDPTSLVPNQIAALSFEGQDLTSLVSLLEIYLSGQTQKHDSLYER